MPHDSPGTLMQQILVKFEWGQMQKGYVKIRNFRQKTRCTQKRHKI